MKAVFMAACVAFLFSVVAVPAMAGEQWCKPGPETPKTEAEMLAMLKEKGYDVRGTGAEHGCFEAKAIGPDGKRAEIYVDAATGQIVKVKQ